MSKKVTYHMPEGRSEVFSVLAENKDGTIDIGPEDGPAFVTECRVTETPEVGSATAINPEKPEKPAKKEKDPE